MEPKPPRRCCQPDLFGCRRREDDQAGQAARLRDLRSAQRSLEGQTVTFFFRSQIDIDIMSAALLAWASQRLRRPRTPIARKKPRKRPRTMTDNELVEVTQKAVTEWSKKSEPRRANRRSGPERICARISTVELLSREGEIAIAASAHRGRPRGDDRRALRRPADVTQAISSSGATNSTRGRSPSATSSISKPTYAGPGTRKNNMNPNITAAPLSPARPAARSPTTGAAIAAQVRSASHIGATEAPRLPPTRSCAAQPAAAAEGDSTSEAAADDLDESTTSSKTRCRSPPSRPS